MWILCNSGIINSNFISSIYIDSSGATVATVQDVSYPILLSNKDIVEPLMRRITGNINLDIREVE